MLDPTAWDCRLDDEDDDAPETWVGYLIATALMFAPFALGFLIGRVTA